MCPFITLEISHDLTGEYCTCRAFQTFSPGAWLSLLVVIAGIVVASTAEVSFFAKLYSMVEPVGA